MKFETVRINFFYDVFRLLSSRNLATMATWRNDFSLFCKFYFLSRSSSIVLVIEQNLRIYEFEDKQLFLAWNTIFTFPTPLPSPPE